MGNRKFIILKNSFSFTFKAVLFSVSLACFGCSAAECFSPEDQVSFTLPHWPYEDIPLSGWQVSCFYGNSSGIDENSSFFIDSNETTEDFMTVKLKRNTPFCITARPVTLASDGETETLFFMPAGTAYPFLCTAENKEKRGNTCYSMKLTWEDGFTASVMSYFSSSASFNWAKFSGVLHKKSSNSEEYYNPWLLDLKKICRDIEKGTFTATGLNLKTPVVLEKEIPDTAYLSPFIPMNEKLLENSILIPLWPAEDSLENRFLINRDQMIMYSGSDVKKLSVQTVFLPKKYEETVYAKKNSIPGPCTCSSGIYRLRQEKRQQDN